MKKLIAILLFVSSNAFAFPTVVCVVDAKTGLRECDFYNYQFVYGGNGSIDTPHSTLAPSGYTGQLTVTHAFIHDYRIYGNPGTGSTLLIESPANSVKWKIPLGWAAGAQIVSQDRFWPGIIITSSDELCLQNYGVSGYIVYSIHYTAGP